MSIPHVFSKPQDSCINCQGMDNEKTTRISTRHSQVFGMGKTTPGILIAHASPGAVTVDRCVVTSPFNVGRSSECDLPLTDEKVSKRHFTITGAEHGFFIEDLNSTNGTFVNGQRVIGKRTCPDSAIIRVGKEILVFHSDAGAMLSPPPAMRYDMSGPFHSGAIIQGLLEVANSRRHVLLTGPSGSGKELATRALSHMLSPGNSPHIILDYNAARFTSEDEATATIFGVGAKVFSNVDPRPGLIEQAVGGILFLDEVHNLPIRVQRTLLRTLEDGQFSRIGESKRRPCDVHFVLASNELPPNFGLAHDLLARLRVLRIPPLKERIADIPHIFITTFCVALGENGLDANEISAIIGTDHVEAMCLDGFETSNVRGILDLVDRLISKMVTGISPKTTVATVFAERFGHGPVTKRHLKEIPQVASAENESSNLVATQPAAAPTDENASHYDIYKDQIVTAYHQCDGNLTATERLLRSAGIRCTRRWLGIYTKKWGLR